MNKYKTKNRKAKEATLLNYIWDRKLSISASVESCISEEKTIALTSKQIQNEKQKRRKNHFVNQHVRMGVEFGESVESCISEEETISLTSEQI